MRIGLDMDGVVANWIKSVNLSLIECRGATLDPDFEPDHWDWYKENLSKNDWHWMWHKGLTPIFGNAPPYSGAPKFVAELSKLGDIIIMTSRPRLVRDITYEWWFHHGFHPRYPAGFNFFDSGQQKNKVLVDVLVEDCYEYATHYADTTESEVILLDRPWNQRYNTRMDWGVERASGYDEALAMVERKKNEST